MAERWIARRAKTAGSLAGFRFNWLTHYQYLRLRERT
jgi:hypothetical protein